MPSCQVELINGLFGAKATGLCLRVFLDIINIYQINHLGIRMYH